MKFKVCLEFEQNVVEKLPSFVKLVYLSESLINSIFGEVCCFFDLVHLLIESSLVAWLWLTISGMQPNRSSETRDKLM